MSFRFLIVLFFVFSCGTLGALVFSHRGLQDLLRLQSQMRKTEDHSLRLEKENQELSRQIDLLHKNDRQVVEDRLRQDLGYIKKGERLFFEHSSGSVFQ